MHYLEHVVSRHGVATDPAKIEAVQSWKISRCTQEVKFFLGFVGYYRKFCPDFATIARPPNVLSSKEVKFQWEVEEETAFQRLKTLLIGPPCSLTLTLHDSTSWTWMPAIRQQVLYWSQMVDSEERVVAYYSKTFSPQQRNYCVTRRATGGGDGNQPLPAISLWTEVLLADKSCVIVVAVQAYRTITPSGWNH